MNDSIDSLIETLESPGLVPIEISKTPILAKESTKDISIERVGKFTDIVENKEKGSDSCEINEGISESQDDEVKDAVPTTLDLIIEKGSEILCTELSNSSDQNPSRENKEHIFNNDINELKIESKNLSEFSESLEEEVLKHIQDELNSSEKQPVQIISEATTDISDFETIGLKAETCEDMITDKIEIKQVNAPVTTTAEDAEMKELDREDTASEKKIKQGK